MNKSQRKTLERAIDLMEQALAIIEFIKDEEEEKFNNLPEGLQATEASQKIEAGAETLDEIHSNLDSCKDELVEFINE